MNAVAVICEKWWCMYELHNVFSSLLLQILLRNVGLRSSYFRCYTCILNCPTFVEFFSQLLQSRLKFSVFVKNSNFDFRWRNLIPYYMNSGWTKWSNNVRYNELKQKTKNVIFCKLKLSEVTFFFLLKLQRHYTQLNTESKKYVILNVLLGSTLHISKNFPS